MAIEEPVLQYNQPYYAVPREKEGWQHTRAELNEAITGFHEAGTNAGVDQ